MLSNRRYITAIVRSYTSRTILKNRTVFTAENDLEKVNEATQDTIQIVESMLITSADMKGTLNTGLNPAALAATLETFIRSHLDLVTELASLLTDSNVVGVIADASASMTSQTEINRRINPLANMVEDE